MPQVLQSRFCVRQIVIGYVITYLFSNDSSLQSDWNLDFHQDSSTTPQIIYYSSFTVPLSIFSAHSSNYIQSFKAQKYSNINAAHLLLFVESKKRKSQYYLGEYYKHFKQSSMFITSQWPANFPEFVILFQTNSKTISVPKGTNKWFWPFKLFVINIQKDGIIVSIPCIHCASGLNLPLKQVTPRFGNYDVIGFWKQINTNKSPIIRNLRDKKFGGCDQQQHISEFNSFSVVDDNHSGNCSTSVIFQTFNCSQKDCQSFYYKTVAFSSSSSASKEAKVFFPFGARFESYKPVIMVSRHKLYQKVDLAFLTRMFNWSEWLVFLLVGLGTAELLALSGVKNSVLWVFALSIEQGDILEKWVKRKTLCLIVGWILVGFMLRQSYLATMFEFLIADVEAENIPSSFDRALMAKNLDIIGDEYLYDILRDDNYNFSDYDWSRKLKEKMLVFRMFSWSNLEGLVNIIKFNSIRGPVALCGEYYLQNNRDKTCVETIYRLGLDRILLLYGTEPSKSVYAANYFMLPLLQAFFEAKMYEKFDLTLFSTMKLIYFKDYSFIAEYFQDKLAHCVDTGIWARIVLKDRKRSLVTALKRANETGKFNKTWSFETLVETRTRNSRAGNYLDLSNDIENKEIPLTIKSLRSVWVIGTLGIGASMALGIYEMMQNIYN